MNLPIIIYLAGVSDGCIALCMVVLLVAGFLLLLSFAVYGETYNKEEGLRVLRERLKILVSLIVGSTLLAIVIPSKSTIYTILAAYGVESVASNDRVQSLAENSLKLLEKTLEEYNKE